MAAPAGTVGPVPPYTARPGEAVRVFRNDDGSFAIGCGRIRIATADQDMAFVSAVAAELGKLAHSPAGQGALNRGDMLGHPVFIEKPKTPSNPPNAWALPDDVAAATAAGVAFRSGDGRTINGTGAGCGSTIAFDPSDWPENGDGAAPARADILLAMIEQANANAAGKSNPSLPDWGIPLRR